MSLTKQKQTTSQNAELQMQKVPNKAETNHELKAELQTQLNASKLGVSQPNAKTVSTRVSR